MNSDVFLDTNILIYAIHSPKADEKKQKIALDLLKSAKWAFSTVVLGEFYTVATKAAKNNLTHQEAMLWINGFMAFPCQAIDAEMALKAMSLKQRFNLQYFDSTHVIAAQKMGLNLIYSEDYKHNETYDGVRVINPFLTATA